MNTLLTYTILLLSVGCMDSSSSDTINEIATSKSSISQTIAKDPYDIKLHLGDEGDNVYNLSIWMKLGNGPYIISPYIPGEAMGRFTIVIDENNYFTPHDTITETPASIDHVDPWGEGMVRFIKDDSTFRQKITVNSQENFEVSGWLQFVLEPLCPMEKIPFTISKNDGVMAIQKGN